MPPRDDQDFELRRQQIIDGALDVFASKGFEVATNKDIAEAANIGSPGLIYHYFKDKADLLRHVVEQRAPVFRLLTQIDELIDLPPRQALPRFADAFVQTIHNPTALAMGKLILGEATRRPMVADVVNAVGPGRIFPLLARYMQHQMDAGRLRRMDPGAAARCFFGPLLGYLLTREVFKQPDSRTLTPEAMAATLVDIFLDGMLPPDSAISTRGHA
jgi:TetR/AcrR family transcriptional regulator, mexJK operon transcriptional repressor